MYNLIDIKYLQVLPLFTGLSKTGPKPEEPPSFPNWAVSVLPLPPPLKKRPDLKPDSQQQQQQIQQQLLQQQQMTLAEIFLKNALQQSALPAANSELDYRSVLHFFCSISFMSGN